MHLSKPIWRKEVIKNVIFILDSDEENFVVFFAPDHQIYFFVILQEMVCVPQAEEQQVLEAEERASGAAEAAGAEEERTVACKVYNQTRNSTQTGAITIFVKSSSTVDDLYRQLASAIDLSDQDFDVNLKTDVIIAIFFQCKMIKMCIYFCLGFGSQ
jgi:hypothetical protein